jgi:HEAT repeat protein
MELNRLVPYGALLLVLSHAVVAHAAPAAAPSLEGLFGQALEATEEDYVSLRDSILARGEEAVPFLQGKLHDPDWHVHVLAEAMLGRMREPLLYRHYEELVVLPVARATRFRAQHHAQVAGMALERSYGTPGPRVKTDRPTRWWPLYERPAEPFLLEAALTGCIWRAPQRRLALPQGDQGRSYSPKEAAELLGITERTARVWFLPKEQAFEGGAERIQAEQIRALLAGVRVQKPGLELEQGDEEACILGRCFVTAMLGLSQHTAALPALVRILNGAVSAEVRWCAATALAATGKSEAAQPLMDALSDEDPMVPEAAARGLGRLADPRAVDALERALGDERRGVRDIAATALAQRGGAQATQALVRVLKDESHVARAEAAMALGQMDSQEALQALLAAVDDRDPRVRGSAAWALGSIGDPSATDALVGLLQDESYSVREHTTRALGRIGGDRAVEALVGALQDESQWVRQAAARALRDIGDERAVPPLIDAMEQGDGQFIRTVNLVLRSMTGRDFGTDPKAWRQWWETQTRVGAAETSP